MRFGWVHRFMTDSLAVLGILALITSGKLHPWMTGSVLLGLVLALALPERFKPERLQRFVGVALPLGLLALEVGRLILGSDPIVIVVEFAAALQVIRLFTRRGATHDNQVILLSLLHLIAGTVLGGGLTYAVALLGFLIFTPGALVLSHLRREVEGNYRQGARDRTGMPVDVPRILRSRRVIGRGFLLFTCMLSLPVFLFTALLFLAFPRVGFSWLVLSPTAPQRVVGFSDRVDLGGVGTIRTDPTLVMRVALPPEANPPVRKNLYLRGAVFDTYTGRAWLRSSEARPTNPERGRTLVLRREPRPDSDRSWKIDLEPIDPPVLFIPTDAVALRVQTKQNQLGRRAPLIHSGQSGEIQYTAGEPGGISYEAFLPAPGRFVPAMTLPERLEQYLSLPEQLSARTRELSQMWAADRSSAEEIAQEFERRLRQEFVYDLNSPSGQASDPLDHFLFESKRGHCEFYSTAMAILLRLRGIPARNVTGFVGGTFNRFGEFYAVRQGDAHSWVEAYLPERGWIRFDPTPPSGARPQADTETFFATLRELIEAASQGWNEHVVSFNLEKQLNLLRSVRETFRDNTPQTSATVWKKRLRSGVLFAGVLLLVAGGAYLILRKKPASQTPEKQLEAAALRSIELYRKLERALDAQGVTRPFSSPPLRHAEALRAAGHPVGEEAVALTQLYLRARFGGVLLSAQEEANFQARVQALHKLQRPSPEGEGHK